jgi:hypothetical protein
MLDFTSIELQLYTEVAKCFNLIAIGFNPEFYKDRIINLRPFLTNESSHNCTLLLAWLARNLTEEELQDFISITRDCWETRWQ